MRLSSKLGGLVLCVALAACDSGPTAPDRVPPAPTGLLPAGRYLLGISTPLDHESCTGQLEPWGLFGPNIGAFVIVSEQADGWIARLENAADGTLELQLRESGRTGPQLDVSGTLRGTVANMLDRLTSSPIRTVSIEGQNAGGPATLTATLIQPLNVLGGTVTGTATFTHNSGTTVTCSEVLLSLGFIR